LKAIVDTNIVLDVLLAREPFAAVARTVFALVEQSKVEGFLSATSITTVDYLLTQSLSRKDAKRALHRLLEIFNIAPVNRSVIEEALASKMPDFEDAVLTHSGHLIGADVVVTRNIKDFKHSVIKALEPSEFLSLVRMHH
jgi:predicted nucleic-acid-binding protein